MEAISSGKDIDKILLRKDLSSELAGDLFRILKDRKDIVVARVPVERIDRITRKNHQGVVAFLSPVAYYSLENLIPSLFEEGKNPLMVVLDGVTDIRNFGAIARTCECAGVDAIVIPEKNSASVNADAVKTSAGALLHIPVCRAKNLESAIRLLKDSGFKIVGASEKGVRSYTAVDYTSPAAIIMGAEETGIRPENLRLCDDLASIPMCGKINSLNVSVAAGIVVYEAIRQRSASIW